MVGTFDTTDHERAARNRRRRRQERGPGPSAVKAALEAVASHDVPGTPKTSVAGVIRDGVGTPQDAGERRLREVKITSGEPQHGAKRSDDHIGKYEIEVPIDQISDEAVGGDQCPECGGHRALYRYSAYHYISGGEAIFCLACEETLHSQDWG